jgi:hypothetical protein
MREVVYHLTPKALAAVNAERARLLRSAKLGLIPTDTARRLDRAFVEKVLRDEGSRGVSDPDRMVKAVCKDCGREHRMPASVSHYACKCSPHTERSAFLDRALEGT